MFTSLASFSEKSTKYKSTKSTIRSKMAQNFGLNSKLFFCLKNIVQKIKLVRNYQNSQKLSKWFKKMLKWSYNIKKVKNNQNG